MLRLIEYRGSLTLFNHIAISILLLVLKNNPKARLFVVVTSRPNCPATKKCSDSFHYHPLSLAPLDVTATRRIAAKVLRKTPITPETQNQLIEASDGIPLFLEQLCLSHNRRHSADPIDLATPDIVIPTTLQNLLNTQLDQFGQSKVIAQLAAVFNGYFSHQAINSIASRNRLIINQSLEVLTQSKVLQAMRYDDETWYVFRHHLLKQAAYQSLLKKTRQRYHTHIAEFLAKQPPCPFPDKSQLPPFHLLQLEPDSST